MQVSLDMTVPYDSLRNLRIEGSRRRWDPQATAPLVDLGFGEAVRVDVCQKGAGMPIGSCHLEQSPSQVRGWDQMNASLYVFVGSEHRLPHGPLTDKAGNRCAFEKFASGGDIVDPGDEIDGLYPLLSTPNGSGRMDGPTEVTDQMLAEGVRQHIGLK